MTHFLHPEAQRLIRDLQLEPHPEGGYFKETYRAPLNVVSPEHEGTRHAYTTIYFLLAGQQRSAWHRVASDESWFFHMGSDVDVLTLSPQSGELTIQTIGFESGRFECTIAAHQWFAAKPKNPDSYCLVSCVVAPGFTFDDFVLATRADLQKLVPASDDVWPLIEPLIMVS